MSTDVEIVRRSHRARTSAGVRVRVSAFIHDHPLVFIAIIAGAARFVTTFIAAKYFSGSYVFDDGTYMMMAEAQVNDSYRFWDPYTRELYTTTSAFMRPLTFLFEVFAPVKLLGQMFVAVVGTVTAVVTTRIAMTLFRPWIAVVAGLVVALLPSQVLWSALIMKDAMSWVLLASTAVFVLFFNRAQGWGLVPWGAGAAVTLTGLAYVREHTFLIATWAFIIAVLFSIPRERVVRIVFAVAFAVAMPIQLGYGIGGYDYVTSVGSLEQERIQNALGANTGIIVPDEEPRTVRLSQDGWIHGRFGSGPSRAGSDRPGGGEAAPEAPGLIEVAVQPLGDEGTLTPDIAHLPRGLSVILLEPYPWQPSTSQSFRYAAMESVIWYPILLIALIGVVGAFRKLTAMAYPLAVGGGLIFVDALTEGNVGTAFRHRSEFVWVIALLFGFGLTAIYRRFQRRRTAQAA